MKLISFIFYSILIASASSGVAEQANLVHDLRDQTTLLQQELLRYSLPHNMSPLERFSILQSAIGEKCYPLENIEKHIELLMQGVKSSLEIEEIELERYGRKHANIVKQAHLVEVLSLPGINVPIPYGITSDTIHAFLQNRAPEVFDHWNALGILFAGYTGSARFLEEPFAAEHLTAIDAAITTAFTVQGAFDELSLPPEFIAWLKDIKKAGNYLMVRSTGSEDSRQMANAGGNVSKAYVSPDNEPLCIALSDVVRSYFGYGSLQNRINAGQNPFEQELKLAVTMQELIGEEVGGSKRNSQIPISLVLFTDEPLYSGNEGFRVMRISASYGHGEGVVGNLGIATDTATVLISDAHPDQLYVLYDNKKKLERLAPMQDHNGISLQKIKNPLELQNRPVLTLKMLARLYHWGVIGEKFFDGEATDMEIIIKGDTIYPVQARPVNRLALLPTYLDRRKLALAEISPLLESIQAESLVPGRASAFAIEQKNQVLMATTLQEAEAAFIDSLHSLVIVQQPEPANSHPVVNFSNLGIPCLFAQDNISMESLLNQISLNTPLVVCMQTGSIHLWDSQKGNTEDYISSGFAVHPAKIAISIPFASSKNISPHRPQVPQEISDLLIRIRDAKSQCEVLDYLNRIQDHSWVQDANLPLEGFSVEAQEYVAAIHSFAVQFDSTMAETKQAVQVQRNGMRLKPLFHLKAMESLLTGNAQKHGSIAQYALPDIWAAREVTKELNDYQEEVGKPARCIDLLRIGDYALTAEAKTDWREFLLSLEQEDVEQDKIDRLKQLVYMLEQANVLNYWLTFDFTLSTNGPLLSWVKQIMGLGGRLELLINSVSSWDLELINDQLSLQQELDAINRQVSSFQDTGSFKAVWANVQELVSPKRQSTLILPLQQQCAPVAKVIALKNMQQLVDLFDTAIKTMKSSSLRAMEEKVPLFKEMLVPYFSLLKIWHEELIGRHSIPLHSSWSIIDYLSKLESTLLNNVNLGVDQLHPSSGFSVSAAVLGSMTAFDRHLPVTLEDCFTLIHQNLMVCTGTLNKKLFSESKIAQSSLPENFKSASQKIAYKYPLRTNFEIGTDHITTKFNMALRNHSAGITVVQSKDQPLKLIIQLFGEARIRWYFAGAFIEAMDDLGIVKLAKVPFKSSQELTVHCIIEDEARLEAVLTMFEVMCEFSFNLSLNHISDLKQVKEMDLFDKFVQKLGTKAWLHFKDPDKENADEVLESLLECENLPPRSRWPIVRYFTKMITDGIAQSDPSIQIAAVRLASVGREMFRNLKSQVVSSGVMEQLLETNEPQYASDIREFLATALWGKVYVDVSLVVKAATLGLMDNRFSKSTHSLWEALIYFHGQRLDVVSIAEKALESNDPTIRENAAWLIAYLTSKGLYNKNEP